jgi:hypothetical protein
MIEAIELSAAGSPEAAFHPSLKKPTVALATLPKEPKSHIGTGPRPSPDPHPSPTFASTPAK